MSKSRVSRISLTALLSALFLICLPAYAQDNHDSKPKTNNASSPSATNSNAAKGHLSEEENPTLIGKRDINKHQINFYSLQKEIGLGQQMAAEAEHQLKFIEDPVVTEYVNRVGQNIVLNSDAKVPFTIKVVDSDEVNAFALPGGFFFVNKGLILAADNESEIVGVMAHEIAHVCARHGTEQVSKGQLLQFGSIPLIFLGGPIGLAAQSAANFALPLTFLKFSRNAEAEADMLGAEYAWASGYDPMGMVAMFEKLASKEKNKPGTMSKLFSDHPATGDRAVAVRNLIARFPERDEYIVNTSDFNTVKARLQMLAGGTKHNIGGGPNGNGSDHRPTLKRRTDGSSGPDADPASGSAPNEPKERPTLKRRDGDNPGNNDAAPADSQPSQSSDPSGRPTLKRPSDSNQDSNNNN